MVKYFLLSFAIILSALFVFVRVKKGGVTALLLKTCASLFFVVLALYGCYVKGMNGITLFVVLGLVFGMIGDIVLDLKVIYSQHENTYLNAGIATFSLGHVMYLFATIFYANSMFVSNNTALFLSLIGLGFAGIVTTFIGFYGESLLKLNFGINKIQVVVYTFVLSFMSAFSVAVALYKPIFLVFALGIVLIFVSDLVLSLQYFGNKQNNKILTIINHAIYYIAQIAISFSIFLI